MKTYELYSQISGITSNSASSQYLTIGDTVVRIADHLPRVSNFEEYNSETRVFLVFISNELSEREIEKFLHSEMSNYEVDYVLFEENDEIDVTRVLRQISSL
jgi:predicted ABC-class ATPase